jgi:hypothetical protein
VLVVPLKQMEVKEKVRGCQDGREMSIYWLTSLELSSRSGHESKRGWKGESSTFTSAVWPFLSPSHPRRRLGAERQTANLGLSVCKASIPFPLKWHQNALNRAVGGGLGSLLACWDGSAPAPVRLATHHQQAGIASESVASEPITASTPGAKVRRQRQGET